MRIPREPNAEMRQWSSSMRELFVSLTDEGFTEDQALRLMGEFIRRPTDPPKETK